MADLTYKALVQAVQDKEKRLTRNAESIRQSAHKIDEYADETARDADALAAKSVDRDSTAECQELARIIRGVSEAALNYAARGADTVAAAQAATAQARTTHGGFQEAFDRSTVTGLEDVSRDWLEQE